VTLTKSPFVPTPSLLWEALQRKFYGRIQRKEEDGFVRQWFLLCGSAAQESLLNPQPASLRKLFPPPDRIWADPFLWKHGNDFFIFCEEWLYGQPYGQIAVMQLLADGGVAPSRTILAKEHHLSYPFLFEYEGALYLLPEAGGSRAIDVYDCEAFPERWCYRTTLIRNIEYVDATLFEFQGKWWLFASVKRGLLTLNRDLFLFWADTPLSKHWEPHPQNPVVRGLTSARPAGPVFEVAGKLYRPSQNCLVRYGYSLNINEIVELGTRRYRERLVTEIRPDWEPGIRAVHHINWRAGQLVMDAQKLVKKVKLT
jgi:hypothetical protein